MIRLIDQFLRKSSIYLIKLYQITLSPLIGNNCRFYPSCSSYGQDALKYHHFLKALFLIFYRLLSCNPWGRSGYDPVIRFFSLKRFFIWKLYGIKRKLLN